jgi:hypothetical protein
MMRTFWLFAILGVVVIVLVAAAPLISALIAGSIASANDCRIDEGSIHTCMVNGRDLGPSLYSMGVFGWLMIATIPIGLVVLVVYLVIMLIVWILLRRRKNLARG